jgi:CHAT domain-containing protein
MAQTAEEIVAALEIKVAAAEAACNRGDFAAGLGAYRDLLAARLAEEASLDQLLAADLVVIDRLGDLAVLFGQFAAADDLFNAMAALTRQHGNLLAADYATLKRAELSLGRGALHEAFERLRELAPRIGDITTVDMSPNGLVRFELHTAWQACASGDRQTLFARLYYLLARLVAALGQYPDAIAAADRSTVHTGADAVDLALQARVPIALARAGALFEGGDLDAADAALCALGALDVARPGFRVAAHELRARLDLARGEFAGAAAALEQVLALCRAGGFRQAAITAHLNRAHVLILLNRVRDALDHISEAERAASALCDNAALARARFLRAVGNARRRSLADATSLELSLTETLEGRRGGAAAPAWLAEPGEVPQSANFLTLFEDRALQLQWLIAQRRLDAAQAMLDELCRPQVFGATPSRLVRARLAALQGLLAYYRGAPQEAARLLGPAADELAAMRLRPELWQVLRVQGWCAARLGRTVEEQGFVQRAERLIDEMANSLAGAERAIFLLNKWTADEEYLGGEIARLTAEKTGFRAAPRWRRPFAWLRMACRLSRLLARLDQHRALLAENTVGSAPSAQHRAPSLLRRLFSGRGRCAVISFLVLPDRVLAVACARAHLDFEVAPLSRIALREEVRRWHEHMFAGAEGETAQPSALASLSEALRLSTLIAALPTRITQLTIIPDDVLHGFPFTAARLGDVELIDRFAVSTHLETAPPHRRRVKQSKALLVAVSSSHGELEALPQTIDEVARLRDWLEARGVASETLIDGAASKAAVKRALESATLFHIACHGRFEPDRPDASGMLLIPEPGRIEMLSLRDLSVMQLKHCAHVTLSSCWSADNFILPGRYLVSLPETLYRAGARTIIACLWPVEDRVGAAFMARFYALAEVMPRAEALRRSQMECRAGALRGCEDLDTRDPIYWAGFTLFGETDRLVI